MRCRHRRVIENWRWFGKWVVWPQAQALGLPLDQPDAVICAACKHQLPLGPAREDGPHVEQVAIEIRAAELATRKEWNDDETPDEISGLYAFEFGRFPRTCSRGAVVGYLACVIASHDKEQP